MLIGELVHICGLSKDTLRDYEDMGLIHSRPVQGESRSDRDYDATTLERLALIAVGKRMHFSQREIVGAMERIINDQITREKRRGLILAQIEQVHAKTADLENVKRHRLRFAEQPDQAVVNTDLKEIGLRYT